MITQSRLREVLEYDPDTGIFRWLEKTCLKVKVGKEAGTVETRGGLQYRRISIFKQIYYAHRLAWLYVHGEWPEEVIDHRDGNGLNNSISNIRAATQSENCANVRRSSKCSSGLKGAQKFKRDGTFMAQITVRGKKMFLGYYKTADEAHAAYVDAAKRHFGDFARAL